jgi:hypothetical protein
MPATKYPPIQEVHRAGSVPKIKIRQAIEKLAELRENHPAEYKKKIQSGSHRDIRLVTKHGHA